MILNPTLECRLCVAPMGPCWSRRYKTLNAPLRTETNLCILSCRYFRYIGSSRLGNLSNAAKRFDLQFTDLSRKIAGAAIFALHTRWLSVPAREPKPIYSFLIYVSTNKRVLPFLHREPPAHYQDAGSDVRICCQLKSKFGASLYKANRGTQRHVPSLEYERFANLTLVCFTCYQTTDKITDNPSKRSTQRPQRLSNCPKFSTNFRDSRTIGFDLVIEMKSAVMKFSAEMDGQGFGSVEKSYE